MFSVSEMNFWFVEPEKWSRKKIGFNSIRMRTGWGRVHLLQRDKMRKKKQDNSFSWKNLDYKLSMSQQHSWCGNKGKHHTREYHPDNLWVILELCSALVPSGAIPHPARLLPAGALLGGSITHHRGRVGAPSAWCHLSVCLCCASGMCGVSADISLGSSWICSAFLIIFVK